MHISSCFFPSQKTNQNQVIELCNRIKGDASRHGRLRVHPAIGMHPEKADLDALDSVLRLIDEHTDTIVCVGEVGLDFSRHLIGEAGGERAERAKEVQREVFRRQARRAEVGAMKDVFRLLSCFEWQSFHTLNR